MGACGTKLQREVECDVPRVPSIADYEPSRRYTPIKYRKRGSSADRNNMDKKLLRSVVKPFKFQSRDRTLLRQKFDDKLSCSISTCRSLKRIILLFKYYSI